MQTMLACLLISIHAFALAGSAHAARVHEYSAETIRVEQGRIYLWVNAPIVINNDFTIEIESKRHEKFAARVDGVLHQVVISDTLPSDIFSGLQDADNYHVRVFLDTSIVSDSLIIALPENLRRLELDTIWTANPNLNIRYVYRYFDDIREVEIAARLEQVDVLIAPRAELPPEATLKAYPIKLDWYLFCEFENDDLLSTALTYCLKNELASDTGEFTSSMISEQHLREVYPRSASGSRELFLQSRLKERGLGCYFGGYKMYRGLTAKLNDRLGQCSERRLVFSDKGSNPTLLMAFARKSGDSLNTPSQSELRDYVMGMHQRKPLWNNARLDSCLAGSDTSMDCNEKLSRAIAESGRVIALGQTAFAVRKFEHVRNLNDPGREAILENFYRVKP